MKFETFTDKVAVVTGGTSGIGKGIAERLVEAGATVVAVGRDEQTTNSVAEAIGARPATADVTDSQSMDHLAQWATMQFGKVDIVVNNAGVGPLAPFSELTLDDFRWTMDANFWGVVNGMKSFAPLLVSNPTGGAFVNTASVAALIPSPGATAYAASKAAVLALSEAARVELADENVHVASLIPAVARTRIKENAKKPPGHYPDAPPNEDFSPPLPLLEPAEVGSMVLDGLRQGAKYIFTHPHTQAPIQARSEDLLGAHETLQAGGSQPVAT